MQDRNEEDLKTQDLREALELVKEASKVDRPLRELGISEERAVYLSSHNNVLSELPSASAENWDVIFATAVLSLCSQSYPDVDFAKFREENLSHIERLILETESDQPEVELGWEEVQAHYGAHPRWATYIYSRIAKGRLIEDKYPEYALQIYESALKHIYPLIERKDNWPLHESAIDRIVSLYAQVGRYEDAVNLVIRWDFQEWWNYADPYHFISEAFTGWMGKLSKSGGITEVKRFLDLLDEVDWAYGLDKDLRRLINWAALLHGEKVDSVDSEDHDLFKGLLIETCQYWSWFYGYALGTLLGRRPGLRQSLLEEIDAGEWKRGWLAIGVIFDYSGDSWSDYREWALRLYHATEIRALPEFPGSSLEDRLSPVGDLYWAMRVGFADAHIELGGDRNVNLGEIAEKIDQVRDIVSSSALRTLGIETKLDQVSQDISSGLPPTEEHRKDVLRQVLGSVYGVLPEPTIQHLAKALDRRHAKDPDGQRVAIGQAVESLFYELVVEVQRVSEDGISLMIQQGRNPAGEVRIDGRYVFDISMSEWSQILDTVGRLRTNLPFESALNKAFLDVDLLAFGRLNTALREIAKLRGNAPHHSRDSWESKARKATELWNIVVGGEESTGFLERFCIALGLMEEGAGQRGKG